MLSSHQSLYLPHEILNLNSYINIIMKKLKSMHILFTAFV